MGTTFTYTDEDFLAFKERIRELEAQRAALEADVERLRELTKMYLSDCKEWIDELNEVKRQRDELRALLREVSSELIYGRHPAQGEHHLAGKVRAALGEEVK
jgi:uncharacterized coiled-coil DUF342 family protein